MFLSIRNTGTRRSTLAAKQAKSAESADQSRGGLGHGGDPTDNAEVCFKHSTAGQADFVDRIPIDRAAVHEIVEADFVL